MLLVLVKVTIVVINTMTKNSLGKEGIIWLTHYSLLREARQELNLGINLESGADADIMEGYCLLAVSLIISWSTFFLIGPRTTSPVLHHTQWSGPSTFNYCLRKCLRGLPRDRSYEGIFLTASLLSDDKSLCKLGIRVDSTVLLFNALAFDPQELRLVNIHMTILVWVILELTTWCWITNWGESSLEKSISPSLYIT